MTLHRDNAVQEKLFSTSCMKSEVLGWKFAQMFLLTSLSCVDIFILIYMCYFGIRSNIWMRFHFYMSIILYCIRFNDGYLCFTVNGSYILNA